MKHFKQHYRALKFGKLVRPLGSLLVILILLTWVSGCKKFVTVDQLNDKLLNTQVFNSEATANNAIAGIYTSANDEFTNYSLSYLAGLSADEVVRYNNVGDNFYDNNILPTDLLPWGGLYKIIYQCNDAIEGLNNGSLPEAKRNPLLGEAKFMRAFCNFYLVNLYGDVPLIISTDVNASAKASRTNAAAVYAQVISDLLDAETQLSTVNAYAGGERIRANKWVAKAMLARVYLYQKDWANAFKYADEVIKSNAFMLSQTADVFKKNSTETILQLAINSTQFIYEAQSYLPNSGIPGTVCTNSLLSAFEIGDQRKSMWTKTYLYSGITYNYPYKYTSSAINPPEYYMLLRLAEQYLIRAEAKAMQSDFEAAINDVNLLRQKHGGLNAPLSIPANQQNAMQVIMHERRVELFTEQAHRWFDLKRTSTVDAIISAEKPGKWKATAALWPIPLSDILKNNSLKQNPGYTQ